MEERRTEAAAMYEKGAEMTGWVGAEGETFLVEEQKSTLAVVVV